jgi:hypothetical protein
VILPSTVERDGVPVTVKDVSDYFAAGGSEDILTEAMQ